jgi:hypothetical protein
MWKSKEANIREQFHPRHLVSFLEKNNILDEDGEAIDKFLIQFT